MKKILYAALFMGLSATIGTAQPILPSNMKTIPLNQLNRLLLRISPSLNTTLTTPLQQQHYVDAVSACFENAPPQVCSNFSIANQTATADIQSIMNVSVLEYNLTSLMNNLPSSFSPNTNSLTNILTACTSNSSPSYCLPAQEVQTFIQSATAAVSAVDAALALANCIIPGGPGPSCPSSVGKAAPKATTPKGTPSTPSNPAKVPVQTKK